MAISVLGCSTDDIRKKLTCIDDAWRRAQGSLTLRAIAAHTAQDMVGLLAGAVAMVVASALVILVGNVGGSALGGIIGGFTTGGAGAVPGALAGRLIGNAIATGLLQVLGVGLLIQFIAGELDAIGGHFYTAVDCAWNSSEMGGELYEMRMEYSAKHFAEGVGKFFGAMVMALVIVMTRRATEHQARIFNSKLMKICDGLQIHIAKNLSSLEVKYKGGLAKSTVTAGLPETPEGLVAQRATARIAQPFSDMPSFMWRRVSGLQVWLRSNRFVKVAEVRKPGEYLADGTKATDFKSEIWMRQRTPGGDIECVRIDPAGHREFKFRDGPFRYPVDAKTGVRKVEQIAWGERPHYHLDTIPMEKATPYQSKYVPSAKCFTENGKLPEQVTSDAQLAQVLSSLFGTGAATHLAPGRFELIHIPLAP